ASSRTLSIEETFLEPPALTPPPTRHALFIILIALATLLHVATVGSGDLYSQTEGQYAGAAREMVEAHHWLLPTNDGIPRLQKPLVSALIAGAILCGLCGYQRRRHRRGWFAGFWICSALACLTKGLLGIVYLAAVFVLISVFYREARMRFRALLRWEYLLIFC